MNTHLPTYRLFGFKILLVLLLLILMFSGHLPLAIANEGSDDPTPRAELQAPPEAVIEICRKSGGGYGYSTDVAAGAKNSNVHKADVMIYFNPEPVVAQYVTISVSGDVADGSVSSPKASKLEIGSATITGQGSITIAVSPSGITGTFTSSNKLGNITISADDDTVSVDQKWDHRTANNAGLEFDPFFEYDTPHDISLTLELTESSNYIDSHELVFEVTKVVYEQLDLTNWTFSTAPTVTSDFDKYAKFNNQGKATTGSDGKGKTKLTISGSPDNDWTIFVSEVSFKVRDTNAKK